MSTARISCMLIDPRSNDPAFTVLTNLRPVAPTWHNAAPERPAGPVVFQIAAGVALGIVVAVSIIWAAHLWMLTEATKEASRQIQASISQAQADEETRRAAQAARTPKEQEQLAQVQRATYAAQMQAISEKARREQAWQQFYRPSALCTNPADTAAMECSNEFIRAKRRFDAAWLAGKL